MQLQNMIETKMTCWLLGIREGDPWVNNEQPQVKG